MNYNATNIFSISSYIEALNWAMESHSINNKGVRSKLSHAIGCQPSYLSRVLSGIADLSLEQAHRASVFFGFNKTERNYFIALVGSARAGTKELQTFWNEQKDSAKAAHLELSSRIDTNMPLTEEQKAHYFSKWYIAAIHASLGIENLRTSQALVKHLHLDLQTVNETLNYLESIGLVSKVGNSFHPTTKSIHLDKNSPLVGRHHLNWKLRSMDAINQPLESDLQYTSIISISKNDMDEIRNILMKSIETVRNTVKQSKEEQIACYSISLFQINRFQEKIN